MHLSIPGYVCMYVYVCAYMYMCVPICVCMCLYVYMYVYVCAYVCVCMCMCVPICVCVCVCTRLYQFFLRALAFPFTDLLICVGAYEHIIHGCMYVRLSIFIVNTHTHAQIYALYTHSRIYAFTCIIYTYTYVYTHSRTWP